MTPTRERLLHVLYEIGIWFKGIDGVVEFIGGVLFLAASKALLTRWVIHLTQHELIGDPTDWIATHLRHAVAHLSSNTKVFASLYLVGHGATKILLVWVGLWRRKLWAYPTAIIVLSAFICYQLYRVLHRNSVMLIVLSSLDFIIVLLIWREYGVERHRAHAAG